MARPDLETLALLVAVAQEGSIGRVAALSGLSQPSVSRRLAALERRLGVRLLARTTRGSDLTDEGRLVVDWASELLDAADTFSSSVASLRSEQRVGVRVAASLTVAEYLAPAWLVALQHRMPQVRASLAVANSTEVVDRVRHGTVDVGFVESPSVPRDLARARVGSDALVVVVAPDHPWARRHAVTATELADGSALVREPGSGTRETLEVALATQGLTLRPAVELPSSSAVRAAALTGAGAAVLSGLAVAAEISGGRLVRVPVPGLELSRPLHAVWRRGERPTGAAAALLALARQLT
jgi:DNA-binding transcriptional LysR family regulator